MVEGQMSGDIEERSMDKEQYVEMFDRFGLYCTDGQGNEHHVQTAYNGGRVLRHPTIDMPTVYFCGNEHGVYFVAMSSQSDRFVTAWRVLGPQKDSDNAPRYMTLVPVSGFERMAFEGLLSGQG